MATQHELSQRHPDVVITSLPPGAHANGAIWRIHPARSLSPTMWAYTDEQAERYAKVLARLSS